MRTLRLLLLDDSDDDAHLIVRVFRRAGYSVKWKRVQSAAELDRLLSEEWDIVLVDHSMPGFCGTEAVFLIRNSNREVPVISVTGERDPSLPARDIAAGANAFLSKDDLQSIVAVAEEELNRRNIR